MLAAVRDSFPDYFNYLDGTSQYNKYKESSNQVLETKLSSVNEPDRDWTQNLKYQDNVSSKAVSSVTLPFYVEPIDSVFAFKLQSKRKNVKIIRNNVTYHSASDWLCKSCFTPQIHFT